MDVEPINNSLNLEAEFRKHVKQYRALLRWGVDKVFQDNQIEVLFFEVKRHIDTGDSEKAETLLNDLKAQINSLEDLYPSRKTTIENDLYSKIQQLEKIIDNSNLYDQNTINQYLQTLEIARVAIQNNDWAEAKSKINLVESDVLDPQAANNADTNTDKSNTKTAPALVAETKLNNKNVTKVVTTNKTVTETKVQIEAEAETKAKTEQLLTEQLKAQKKAPITNHPTKKTKTETQPVLAKKSAIKATTPNIAAQPNNKIKAKPALKTSSANPAATLNPVAQALKASATKTMIGRILSEKDLLHSFHAMDQTHIQNLRIGFIASPKMINEQLSCFARNATTVKETGTQFLLLRRSISRELTVYLIGIPANENTAYDELPEAISQLAACFVNTHDIEDKCIKQLTEKLSNLPANKDKLFIKPSSEKDEANTAFNGIECTTIKGYNSLFIEDAVSYMAQYTQLK